MLQPIDNHRFISVHWAAQRLGFAERTIRKWAQNGVLPAIRLGEKIWGVPPSAIEDFKSKIRQNKIRPRRRYKKEG